MAKKKARPAAESKPGAYTYTLRFDEAEASDPIVQALAEMETETRRSRNQAILLLIQEGLREKGYLPPRTRQPPSST